MDRKIRAIPRMATAALGLWMAGPAVAQTATEPYAASYGENAYLIAPPALPEGMPVELSGYEATPPASSGQMGTGIMTGPGGIGPYPFPGPGAGMAGPAGAPPAAGAAAPAAAPPGTFAPGLGGAPSLAGGALNMIGDQSPFFSIQQVTPVPPTTPPDRPPPVPGPQARSLLAPSVRGFKIAENQSPIPQDRIFYNFNYFEDVNKTLNDVFETPFNSVRIYRHVFGLEKTLFGGSSSVGLRLPLNTLYARDRTPVRTGGNSTSLGDLTVFGKRVFWQDPHSGSLASFGLAITPPTGPERFAGAEFIGGTNPIHNTSIQPFLGYYLSFGNLFVHGFSALDVPVDPRDVTILYNDLGLGYYLLDSAHRNAFLTAVVPTVEAHVNTPLNHRNEYDLFDPSGTPDILNITAGINFELRRTAVMTFGFVTPVTGPRPFDYEVVLLFNVRFGGSRAARRSIPPLFGT